MRSHGKVATYNGRASRNQPGCRCVDCTRAASEARARNRAAARLREEKREYRSFFDGRPQVEDLMTWAERAACRDLPKRIFFPAAGRRTYDQAREVCAACPVRSECLQYALSTRQTFGFWGGMTPDERDPLLKINAYGQAS